MSTFNKSIQNPDPVKASEAQLRHRGYSDGYRGVPRREESAVYLASYRRGVQARKVDEAE